MGNIPGMKTENSGEDECEIDLNKEIPGVASGTYKYVESVTKQWIISKK